MSHFSKIQTSITDIEILKITIKELGLEYEILNNDDNEFSVLPTNKNLFVYDSNIVDNDTPLMIFEWTGSRYTIVVDLELWNLDINFNYFADNLFQQYAYNVVINNGSYGGFSKVKEDFIDDGSIRVVFQQF